MTDLYDEIPKVELHCHVEGTVRAAAWVVGALASGEVDLGTP